MSKSQVATDMGQESFQNMMLQLQKNCIHFLKLKEKVNVNVNMYTEKSANKI
jgi:hypothetical protein